MPKGCFRDVAPARVVPMEWTGSGFSDDSACPAQYNCVPQTAGATVADCLQFAQQFGYNVAGVELGVCFACKDCEYSRYGAVGCSNTLPACDWSPSRSDWWNWCGGWDAILLYTLQA